MNNDLIFRKDAKYMVKQTAKQIAAQNGTVDDITYALKIVYDEMDEMPAVDAAPVVHARWIYYPKASVGGNDVWACGECGTGYNCVEGHNYCLYCGAKMDGESDDAR